MVEVSHGFDKEKSGRDNWYQSCEDGSEVASDTSGIMVRQSTN